ncbi:MAG: hypothetical protein AAF266_14555 [Planctomycetota bacterium]
MRRGVDKQGHSLSLAAWVVIGAEWSAHLTMTFLLCTHGKSLMLPLARFAVLLGLIASTASQVGAAPFVPVGPQNDIPIATVTDQWGWSLIYDGAYGEFDIPIETVFGAAQDFVMLGAYLDGTDTLEVLAAARTDDVLSFTPLNTPRSANGAVWYYNGNSMGFAGAGDTIRQSTADTNGGGERDRLSWHTGIGESGFRQDPTVTPLDIDGGWRAGTFTGLNNNQQWRRVVFTAVIPEPASAAGLLIAVTLLASADARTRRSATWCR